MIPKQFIQKFIQDHEGCLSLHPSDSGNYYKGVLVGSKYGVTGDTLVGFIGKPNEPASAVKIAIANLTLDEAVDIGYQSYYMKPSFQLLTWNQVTAAILDHGWISGPSTAVKIMQRMIGAVADGNIGPATASAYNAWINKVGLVSAANLYANARIAFFHSISGGKNAVFLDGWVNRANSFRPDTSWWKSF